MSAEQAHAYVSEKLTRPESQKELEDFNRFMWKYLGIIFAVAFLIGVGIWMVPAYGCGEFEPLDTTINQINEKTL